MSARMAYKASSGPVEPFIVRLHIKRHEIAKWPLRPTKTFAFEMTP